MKIILADDHILFRDALTQYLERADPDISVFLTDDFHGALNILSAEKGIGLVMLDLHIPGMGGPQGLARLRALHPEVPVAVLSGIAESPGLEECFNFGAAGYFPKTLPGKM